MTFTTVELAVTIRAEATDAIRNLNELRGKLMGFVVSNESKERTADILESAQQANRDAVAAAYRRGQLDEKEQNRKDQAQRWQDRSKELQAEYNRGYKAAIQVRETAAAFARQAGYEEGFNAAKGKATEHYDDGFRAGAESAANQYTRDLAAAIEQFNKEAVSADDHAKAQETAYQKGRNSLLDDILEDLGEDDCMLDSGGVGEALVRSLINILTEKYR